MVSAISSSTTSIYGTSSSSSNTAEKSKIQKQINELENKIKEIEKDDSYDAQTKIQLVTAYQLQITQLQAQLNKLDTASNQAASSNQANVDSDTVTISNEARQLASMPPPLDFENMSDEEFTQWLVDMQEETGAIPGAPGVASVSDLTDEQLQTLRDTLSSWQDKMMSGSQMDKTLSPPPTGLEDNNNINGSAQSQITLTTNWDKQYAYASYQKAAALLQAV